MGPVLAQQARQVRGLDALSDDALYTELANYGLDSLLERAFEVNRVPPEKRDGVRSLVALRKLADAGTKRSSAERSELLRTIAAGIERALPSMTDPKLLLQQADTLADVGVQSQVNALEYWGENPRTQAELRPVAQALVKILDRASRLASARADQIANSIKREDAQLAAAWTEMDQIAAKAGLAQHVAAYFLAIAMEPADPKRREICDAAIEYLKQYDIPESTIQADVRLRIGKLAMAEGDWVSAKAFFQSVADGKEIKPAPQPQQQAEAQFFGVLSDLLARDVPAAEKGLTDLRAWQEKSLQGNPLEGARAAADVMEYRITSAKAEMANEESDKSKYNKEAVDVLLRLLKQRPQFRTVIYEQLANRLPENPQLDALDPLLLQAIVYKGELERLKDPSQPIDRAPLEQAITAARELIARQGKAGVTDELVDNAALLIPFFQQRLGREPDAAGAFLDFAEKHRSNLGNARLALDNALATIAQLRKEHPEEESTHRLYERALPIAVAIPFERKELAFDYAKLLQEKGKYREAIEYFKQIPPADPRQLDARFYEMLALKQQLDAERTKLGTQAAADIRARIGQLASQVTTAARAAIDKAGSDPNQTRRYRSLLVKSVLLAADLANREEKDPKRALAMLEGFEQSVKGLPRESELLGDALFLRVDSYMDLGRNADATKALVDLLSKESGDKGATIIFSLLQRLDRDLDEAKRSGDSAQMRLLARSRAELSGYLVDWAARNSDPNIKRFTYRYRVFDAGTQLLAAQLETDPTAKNSALAQAIVKYESLQSPAAIEEYRQTLKGTSADPTYPDPAITMGIASVHFERGDYKKSQELFGKLLTDRKLGTPGSYVDGQFVDNDLYWEAAYKLLQSNLQLSKSTGVDANDAGLEESKSFLKRLYIQWGTDTGGRKWASEFEKLRAQLTPDFHPA